MEAWTWLVAYLVGFALLQLVLYRYFRRGESTHDGGQTREPGYRRLERSVASDSADPDLDEDTDFEADTDFDADREFDTDADGVYCQHCGTPNEPSGFTYCRNCTQPLR